MRDANTKLITVAAHSSDDSAVLYTMSGVHALSTRYKKAYTTSCIKMQTTVIAKRIADGFIANNIKYLDKKSDDR